MSVAGVTAHRRQQAHSDAAVHESDDVSRPLRHQRESKRQSRRSSGFTNSDMSASTIRYQPVLARQKCGSQTGTGVQNRLGLIVEEW